MRYSRARLRIPGHDVLEYMGSGARSTIWKVRSLKTNRVCALKRVVRKSGDDDRFFSQAINEFMVAANFDHPAIRKYYKMRRLRRLRNWLRVEELHLFMELCPGQNCQSNRPSEIDRTLDIFRHVARALMHMHARGFVHADMKPNNIIVADDGAVKIIDFGQSCLIGAVKGRIQGTPDFIAPEQVHCRPLDARTDVFNFGAALYWTLTGQPIPTLLPKENTGIQLVTDMNATAPEKLNPDVSPRLSRLVLDCIRLQPARRPQSVKEVLRRLDIIAHTLSHGGPDVDVDEDEAE